MSKVLVIGNYAPDRQKSMDRYADNVIKALKDGNIECASLRPRKILAPQSYSWRGRFKILGYIDKLVIFPLWLFFLQFKYDRIHICDHSNAVYAFFVLGRKCTITCHDVIAIQSSKSKEASVRWTGRLLQSAILCGLKRCGRVICVSSFTRDELVQLDTCFASSVTVIHNPIPNTFLSYWGQATSLVEGKYILHVGSDLPRKNRDFLIEVLALLRTTDPSLKLIFVGPGPTRTMSDLLRKHSLDDSLIFLAGLDDYDLARVYRDCWCFVMPSLSEGFGWPVIEAQFFGAPVFASDIPSLREVGGVSVAYFNPMDPNDAAEAIRRTSLISLKAGNSENLKRFSFLQFSEKMGKVLQ